MRSLNPNSSKTGDRLGEVWASEYLGPLWKVVNEWETNKQMGMGIRSFVLLFIYSLTGANCTPRPRGVFEWIKSELRVKVVSNYYVGITMQ
jgi:hypothetical protein